MIKAIFIDYIGTIAKEDGPELKEAVMRTCMHSDLHNPKDFMNYWWALVKDLEENGVGDAFLDERAILDLAFKNAVENHHLVENIEELKDLCEAWWIHAPLFEDVQPFFQECTLPVYVITNNPHKDVAESMKLNHLPVKGIITGDMVRAYKPHKELYEKAVEVSGFRKEEVIHLGDSLQSDVMGARNAGIDSILINRKGKPVDAPSVISAKDLLEAWKIIQERNAK